MQTAAYINSAMASPALSRRMIRQRLFLQLRNNAGVAVRGVAFMVIACTAVFAFGQQPAGRSDFPSWEELMGGDPLPQRRSTPTNNPSNELTIPPSTWPARQSEPASTPPLPRFDDSTKSLPDPFRNGNTTNERWPGNQDQPTGGIRSTRPVSQGRLLEEDFETSRDRRAPINWMSEPPARGDERRGTNRFDYSTPINSEGDRRFLSAEQPLGTQLQEPAFVWSEKRTSVADLRFPASTVFVHNNGFMERQERAAYLDLIATAEHQWQRLVQENLKNQAVTRTPRAEWEEAFYRFAVVRQQAWKNGKLQALNATPMLGNLPDPFATPESKSASPNAAYEQYRLLRDIANFPQDFVGRPIVLYGRFTADAEVRIEPEQFAERADGDRYGRTAAAFFGQPDARSEIPRNNAGILPAVPKAQQLLRGSLIGLNSGEKLAMVDTKGLITPSNGLLKITEAWRTETNVPVLIKGWVVKHWKDNRPLIYCDSMRLITPRPHVDLIRKNTVDKRRLRDEETWLYYETLKQMELTSHRLQEELAAAALQQRIDGLMADIMETSKADLVKLKDSLTNRSISETTHTRRRAALERRLQQRLAKYKECRKRPEQFQTYVDMFQHPDAWQGDLVTLRGHVRHVVSYPSDDVLFPGRTLHELWLFTDDSQHNPAVIVTPNLPADFPMDAEVIDYVTVTGCFFKRYVYGSQDTDRIAPLVLASHVSWQPTVDQVQDMVASGMMSPGTPRAVRAAAIAGDKTGQATMLLGAFLIMMVFMIMWGRAQREERDRVHLRKVVNDVPVFENPLADSYSSLLSDLPGGTLPDYQSSRSLPSTKFRP